MATATSTGSATATKTEQPPTVILVQGSFQIPEVYQKLVDGLVAKGYPTIHPTLPSCSDVDNTEFPQRSLIDDALKIRSELIRQVEYGGKTVIVVMHSYGGLVGSEAIAEELSYSKRQGQGLPGGVIHLFFYAAFLLEEGKSVLSAFGESPNNDVKVSQRSVFLSFSKKSQRKKYSRVFFSLMADSTFSTGRRPSTTISHRPRHRCGPPN